MSAHAGRDRRRRRRSCFMPKLRTGQQAPRLIERAAAACQQRERVNRRLDHGVIKHPSGLRRMIGRCPVRSDLLARPRQAPHRVGLAMEAQARGYLVRYTTLDELVQRLRRADALGKLPGKLAQLQRPHLVAIDRAGCLPLDCAGANRLFQVINRRYTAARRSSPETRRSPNGPTRSATKCSPPPSSTASSMTAKCSPSTAPATGSKAACTSSNNAPSRQQRPEPAPPRPTSFDADPPTLFDAA